MVYYQLLPTCMACTPSHGGEGELPQNGTEPYRVFAEHIFCQGTRGSPTFGVWSSPSSANGSLFLEQKRWPSCERARIQYCPQSTLDYHVRRLENARISSQCRSKEEAHYSVASSTSAIVVMNRSSKRFASHTTGQIWKLIVPPSPMRVRCVLALDRGVSLSLQSLSYRLPHILSTRSTLITKVRYQSLGNITNHIMVVTCALTRLTLYVPVEDVFCRNYPQMLGCPSNQYFWLPSSCCYGQWACGCYVCLDAVHVVHPS